MQANPDRNPYLLPLTVSVRPSRALGIYLIVSHAASLVLLPCIALPAAIRLILAALLLWSYRRLAREQRRSSGDPITALLLLPDGEWRITTRNGPPCSARLLNDSVVHPSLTVLRYALADGRQRNVTLTPDNVDSATYRQLRVRLRFLPLALHGNAS